MARARCAAAAPCPTRARTSRWPSPWPCWGSSAPGVLAEPEENAVFTKQTRTRPFFCKNGRREKMHSISPLNVCKLLTLAAGLKGTVSCHGSRAQRSGPQQAPASQREGGVRGTTPDGCYQAPTWAAQDAQRPANRPGGVRCTTPCQQTTAC